MGVALLSGCGIAKPVPSVVSEAAPTPSVVAPASTPAAWPTPSPSVDLTPEPATPVVYVPQSTPSVTSPSVTPPPVEPAKPIPPQPAGPYDCAKVKCVALTFDDGPNPATTPKLLDILKENGVHATFFVQGNRATLNKSIVTRIAAEGHVVGNHSYSHPQFWYMDAAGIRSQITRTNTLIKKATGKRPVLLRPPYGESNPTIRSIAGQLGMAQILWSVDPLDWKDKDANTVATRVQKMVKPGAIVLSHDLYPTTVEAYKTIIPALRAKGYVFVTVPQLLKSLKSGTSYSERL